MSIDGKKKNKTTEFSRPWYCANLWQSINRDTYWETFVHLCYDHQSIGISLREKKLFSICIATNLFFLDFYLGKKFFQHFSNFLAFWRTNALYFWEVDLVLLIFISKKWLDIFLGNHSLVFWGILFFVGNSFLFCWNFYSFF